MKRTIRNTAILLALFIITVIAPVSAQEAPAPITLTLVGYAVPREAYGDIIPAFQAKWLEETGQQVNILESYAASGSQSRAVAGGFEADIVGLSIEPDVTRLVDAGLITHDWKDNAAKGIVTNSLVVLAVRPGNPKGITDWAGLAGDGVEIITPDPATSGGAQWNILGAYGAARRGNVEGFEATDAGAEAFLTELITNVAAFDKDGRESFLTFERGVGDVAITYENEVYAGLQKNGEYDIVYPSSTLLIENPVALVDVYVDKHGTREVAQAFIDYLWSPEAQTIFAEHGFRPVNEEVAATYNVNVADATAPETSSSPVPLLYPPVADQFTIEEFEGWAAARKTFFGDEGTISAIITSIRG
ncbi:MAG: sulfate ABC transporter substrate-binding protein [Chloroflexi bacterium]|nr:sulfate ABC transporter substrate-binding protein [Chloroflexota bacterium]MCC6893691.1 sulfate ABC transporter substrate-binding protein [Anaerolineae bacterium]